MLMFSVVAMKSRTFSSFRYSAGEQVCGSWEGTQPGSQPRLANGSIPYRRRHAQYINVGWLGAGMIFFILFFFWKFELFWEV